MMKMICAIFADDPVLRAESLKQIVDKLVAPEDRIFDVKELSGETARAFDIITALESWPIGNGHKVVIVHDAEKISSEKRKDTKTEEADLIIEAAPTLQDFAVLVLVVDTSSQSKLPAKLKAAAKDHTFQVGGATKSEKIEVAINYVKSLFEKSNVKVSHLIASEIVNRIGSECLTLRGEVTKVIDYAGGKPADMVTLDAVLTTSIDDVTFKLVDAVASGNLSTTMKLLSDRMTHTPDTADGEAFRLLSLLRRQFLLVHQAKMLLDRRIDVSRDPIPGTEPLHPETKYDLREVLKRNSWQGRNLVRMARAMSWKKIVNAFATLDELESMMKSPDSMLSDPEIAMTYGLMRICA